MAAPKHSSYRWLGIGIGLLLTLIVVVAGYIIVLLLTRPADSSAQISLTPSDQYDGITRVEASIDLPAFMLTDQHGEPFESTTLLGRPTLIAYGFTRCPDICPLTLGEIRGIHEALAQQAAALNYVFITVDGNRDTPAVLRNYLELLRVDSFLIGLTGSEETVRNMSGVYGVDFVYGTADSNGNYSVDHTAGMFLLDEEGRWIRRYAFGTLRSLIVNDIQAILREQ